MAEVVSLCFCLFPIPTVFFNAVYQFVHIYRHLFNEGIGLRQLLDYYFVLKSLNSNVTHAELMHILSSFGMEPFASAVMWVIAKVFANDNDNDTANAYDNDNLCLNDWQSFDKLCNPSLTKTIKTPDGSASVAVSENSNELDVSAAASSTDRDTVQIQPSGNKQEINQDPSQPSLKGQELDWQQRWPWMICEPNEKRGKFLLNEIMMAGNFGKYDERNVIGANEGYLKRFIRRQKRFLRFLTQYPSEVIWGPYFSVKQRLWRIAHGWR